MPPRLIDNPAQKTKHSRAYRQRQREQAAREARARLAAERLTAGEAIDLYRAEKAKRLGRLDLKLLEAREILDRVSA